MSANAPVIEKNTEKRKILRSFAYYNIGIFLCYAAFVAVFNLQSSINVEGGLGTISIGASYAVSLGFAVFFAPIMVRKLGVKVCVILGDAAPILFFLANLYASIYTLLPAGILMTCLQSPTWPSMSVVNVSFATKFSSLGKRSKDFYIMSFSGYFFLAFQTSQVFGNLISYMVLYGFDQIPIDKVANCTNTGNATNSTCQITTTDYSHCGINDCQNETVIGEQIKQYKPLSSLSLYVLIGVTVCLEVVAFLIHLLLLPSSKTLADFMKLQDANNSSGDAPLVEKEGKNLNRVSRIENEEDSLTNTNDQPIKNEEQASKREDGFISIGINTSKAVIKHLINFKFLLLFPITLYNGLSMSFSFTELTRAFASCSLGVQWVGLCMAIYGVSDALLSWVVGQFGRKIGRIPCYLIGLLIECGNYLQCIFWSSEKNRLLSVVGLFFCFGFSDGILQTLINVTHIDFFEKNRDIAMSAWNLIIVAGFSLGYILSKALCVQTRVYLNLSCLIVGFIGVIIAEMLHRRYKKENKNSDEKEQIEMEPLST